MVAFTQVQVLQAPAVPVAAEPALFMPTEQKLVTAKQTRAEAEAELATRAPKQVQVLAVMADPEL